MWLLRKVAGVAGADDRPQGPGASTGADFFGPPPPPATGGPTPLRRNEAPGLPATSRDMSCSDSEQILPVGNHDGGTRGSMGIVRPVSVLTGNNRGPPVTTADPPEEGRGGHTSIQKHPTKGALVAAQQRQQGHPATAIAAALSPSSVVISEAAQTKAAIAMKYTTRYYMHYLLTKGGVSGAGSTHGGGADQSLLHQRSPASPSASVSSLAALGLETNERMVSVPQQQHPHSPGPIHHDQRARGGAGGGARALNSQRANGGANDTCDSGPSLSAEFIRDHCSARKRRMCESDFVKVATIGCGAYGEVFLCTWREDPLKTLLVMKKLKKTIMLCRRQVMNVRAERDILVDARTVEPSGPHSHGFSHAHAHPNPQAISSFGAVCSHPLQSDSGNNVATPTTQGPHHRNPSFGGGGSPHHHRSWSQPSASASAGAHRSSSGGNAPLLFPSLSLAQWAVDLYFSFQDEEFLYFVLEYCPGGDFMGWLMLLDVFPEKVAQFYAAEMVMAVEALHRRGYAHRDIKPDNLLVDREGHLRLSDFGLSKKISHLATPQSPHHSRIGSQHSRHHSTTTTTNSDSMGDDDMLDSLCYSDDDALPVVSGPSLDDVDSNHSHGGGRDRDRGGRGFSALKYLQRTMFDASADSIATINENTRQSGGGAGNNAASASASAHASWRLSRDQRQEEQHELKQAKQRRAWEEALLSPNEKQKQKQELRSKGCFFSAVGTAGYMAPEVLRTKALIRQQLGLDKVPCEGYGPQCDWWSVGIILYEMFYGYVPFHTDEESNLHYKILHHDQFLEFPGHDRHAREPPPDVVPSAAAVDLMRGLLTSHDQRLSFEEIVRHPFFEGIDFETLRQQRPTPVYARPTGGHHAGSSGRRTVLEYAPPPFVVDLAGPNDTRYFDLDSVRKQQEELERLHVQYKQQYDSQLATIRAAEVEQARLLQLQQQTQERESEQQQQQQGPPKNNNGNNNNVLYRPEDKRYLFYGFTARFGVRDPAERHDAAALKTAAAAPRPASTQATPPLHGGVKGSAASGVPVGGSTVGSGRPLPLHSTPPPQSSQQQQQQQQRVVSRGDDPLHLMRADTNQYLSSTSSPQTPLGVPPPSGNTTHNLPAQKQQQQPQQAPAAARQPPPPPPQYPQQPQPNTGGAVNLKKMARPPLVTTFDDDDQD